MNEFWQRLKQRKLVQWALAYIAAAFALLQGIDIVAQQFGWPDVVRRGITLALVVGFFVALLLAWYHGERGAQKVSRLELLILALILASGGGLLWRFAKAPRDATAISPAAPTGAAATPVVAIPKKSIAVLLFENLLQGEISLLSPVILQLDPAWDQLRGDPRFEALVQKVTGEKK